MKFWGIQQGTNYWVVASAEQPNLVVPQGQRRKVIRFIEVTNEAAQQQAQMLALQYNGTYLPNPPQQ